MFGKMKQRRQENYLHVVHHELVREFAPVLRISNSLGEEKNNLPKTNYKKIMFQQEGGLSCREAQEMFEEKQI